MKTLKTYQKVNTEKDHISFDISKMEDIYAKRKGKADDPHRHNFYTVLIIKQAQGLHKIDFNAYDLHGNQIYFVAPGQVHQLLEDRQSIGYVMTFSTQFLIENSIELSFVERLNLFHNYGQSPPLILTRKQFTKIEYFTNEIHTLHTGNANLKELSIGSFLKLILIECNNMCTINPTESNTDSNSYTITQEFRKSVDKEYKKEHSTTYYANQLHITPDHLNRSIKSTIGKTAKEYILSRIITEAKRLLYFSDLSNKQIGFELGFNEPANFSAFFKKCTQLSPSNFLKKEYFKNS